MKNKTAIWIYYLNYQKPECQGELYQYNKFEGKEYITNMALFKIIYKYVGWLILPFVLKTQTSNKYE